MQADASEPAPENHPRITLLGPQRNPRLEQVTQSLGLSGGRFATITAGWRDRESDDDLLAQQLGGRTINLRLWERMQLIWEADPELEQADRERRRVLTEMQQLYLIGLKHAVEALARIRAHQPRDHAAHRTAIEDLLSILRDLDDRHEARVADLHAEFYATYRPEHRGAVVQDRLEVGRLVADSDAVVITGGHVGVLLGAMHLFNLAPALAYPVGNESVPGGLGMHARVHRPVIAWGAGAMALTERVMLFYDDSVVAPGVSELLMAGLGLTQGLVALPSARERLDFKDTARMQTLASRCQPLVPLLLDTGDQVTLTLDGRVPDGARIVGSDGVPARYPAASESDPAADDAGGAAHGVGHEEAPASEGQVS